MKKNNVQCTLLVLVALLGAMPMGWVGDVHAQAMPSSKTAPRAGKIQHIEGKIKSVDPSGLLLTLQDGTELTLPPSLNIPQETLKEGEIVKASFEERSGQKVVTSLDVKAGK